MIKTVTKNSLGKRGLIWFYIFWVIVIEGNQNSRQEPGGRHRNLEADTKHGRMLFTDQLPWLAQPTFIYHSGPPAHVLIIGRH